jgi:glycosyltransferase involved in cell wall biosynthesis
MKEFVIIIPAYNEENSIKSCIEAIFESSIYAKERWNYLLKRVLVCINGCTDKTEDIVKAIQKEDERIEIIYSKKWCVDANIALYQKVQRDYEDRFIIKVDADVKLKFDCIFLLLNEFKLNSNLIISWGHPIPEKIKKINIYNKLIAKVFSIRSQYYQSEISINDLSEYHQGYGDASEWVFKSKIYFHGRIFSVRDPSFLFLDKNQIWDDVFLAAYLYHIHWPWIIHVNYEANCFYVPYNTLSHYWKVYKRISEDLKILCKNPYFSDYASLSKTKLNRDYIFKQNVSIVLLFIIYSLLNNLIHLRFKFVTYKDQFRTYSFKD